MSQCVLQIQLFILLLLFVLTTANSCPNFKNICGQGSWKDVESDKLDLIRNQCVNLTPVNLTPKSTLAKGHLRRTDFYQEWPAKSLKFTNGPQVIGLHFHCQDDKIINRININAFQDVNNCLQDLNVYNCKLEQIELGAFNGLNDMHILSLASNQLSKLVSNNGDPILAQYMKHNQTIQVYDFPELNVLHLNNNKIESLEDSYFKYTPKLQVLYLDNNAIKTISKNVFSHNGELTTLSLVGNQLTSLDSEIFPASLENLYLKLNKILKLDIEKMHLLLPNLRQLGVFTNIGKEEGWECIEAELFTGYLWSLHINISTPAVNCEPRNSNMAHIKQFLGFVPNLE